jgi:nucleoside-diphosphate-sugar epimerase
MNIFVAGASGAIGQPLIAELIRQGHVVTGMTHSQAGARNLVAQGAKVADVDAFDAAAVEQALSRAGAEIVIDQLTSLPKDPAQMAAAVVGDRRLRLEGGGHLYRAARTVGVRRYLQQSSGFFLKPGTGLADESEGLAIDASPGVAASARAYTELEDRVLQDGSMEGVALRYGFFYGPKTWYSPEGGCGEQARRREIPIIGHGEGVWSFIHIEDAALATVAAITAPKGVYHIVDDDPSPVSVWLPAFSRWVGAPPPPVLSVAEAREKFGEDQVYYATKLRGASNEKAKSLLRFQPRRLEFLSEK